MENMEKHSKELQLNEKLKKAKLNLRKQIGEPLRVEEPLLDPDPQRQKELLVMLGLAAEHHIILANLGEE